MIGSPFVAGDYAVSKYFEYIKTPEVIETTKKTVKGMIQTLFDQIAMLMISGLFKKIVIDNGIGGKNDEKFKNGWVNG